MTEPEQNLDHLMAQLAEGDRSAFTPCFRQLWPRVHALCLAMLRHPHDADDAAQQAMAKILTRASEYDSSRPAAPWALAIAAWECRTLRKKRARRREEPELSLHDAQSELAVEEDFARRELSSIVRSALHELSEGDRATLLANYWDEAEAAVSPTLRKRKQRALLRLRAAFRRLYEPG